MEPKPSELQQNDIFQAEYVQVLNKRPQIEAHFQSAGKVVDFRSLEDRIVQFLQIRKNNSDAFLDASEERRRKLALFAGAGIGLSLILESERKMAAGTPAEELVEERARYVSFAQLQDVRTRINGTSFLDVDSGSLAPSQTLLLLANPFQPQPVSYSTEYFYSQSDDLPVRYPEARTNQKASARHLQALFFIECPTIDELKTWESESSSRFEKDAFFFLSPTVHMFNADVAHLRSFLLEPSRISEEPELEGILNSDDVPEHIVKAAFYQWFSSVDEGSNIYIIVQRAREAKRKGICVNFHQKMEDLAYKTLANIEGSGIPTIDDIPMVLSGEDPGETEFAELGKTIGNITSKTSQREFELDPEGLPWETLVPADKVTVQLDSNRPQKFITKFFFSSEEGEVLNIGVLMDAKKGNFVWTILESHDDPELQQAKRHITRQIGLILSALQRSVDDEYQEKRMQKSVQVTPAQQKRIRIHRAVKRGGGRPINDKDLITPIKIALAERVRKEEPKRQFTIDIPSDNDLRKILGDPTDADFQTIKDELERFNTDGPGTKDFKILASTKTGERLYGYRVNASTPNGYRIVLKRAGNGTLRIVNGKPRTSVYKKNHL